MDIISLNEAATANSRIEIINANPDSASGIVTVPKTIASGETVTIPSGRVAVLPNVIVDGTLNIEGDVFIPAGANFSDLDTQIALKANTADLKEIGVGQTWQDVTASRNAGVTYTNSTGKPIFLSAYSVYASNNTLTLTINGIAVQVDSIDQGFTNTKVVAIIPSGATYSITRWSAGKWFELR